MASTLAAFGLRPIERVGTGLRNSSTRKMKIADGYNVNIFNGDLVKLVGGGTIEKDTGTATATPVGVFLGCTYTDSVTGFIGRQYWPAGTSASDAYGFVFDNPDGLFLVQADGSLGQNAIGANAAIVQGSGNTSTGNSGVALDASTVATTNTLPLRIIDFWDAKEIGSAYPWLIVKINAGMHQYENATGV